MNSVNEDLDFTMELSKDFEDQRLPTLSFSLWEGEKGLEHSYFEKSMRNQTLVVERTAMGRHSIMNIMSNELIRRLEVLDETLEKKEVLSVINKYTQQLKNSEYNWKQMQDIIVSAIKGYKRKMKMRKESGKPRFRSGLQSLESRVNNKLNEKFNWFKKNKKKENENCVEDEKEKKNEGIERKKSKWSHYKNRKPVIKALEKEIEGENPAKAVLFIQNTKDSALANEIREMIRELKP